MIAPTGTELGQHTPDARGLHPGKLHRQRLARGADIEEPLAAIVRPLLLHDVAFVDELLEHAAERLLGDLQDIKQLGDFHAWVAIDEVQHAVVRAAETQPLQNLVGVADEVAVGKEE
jgi:hypothetical protein